MNCQLSPGDSHCQMAMKMAMKVALKNMQEDGIIRRVSSSRAGRWEIVKTQ